MNARLCQLGCAPRAYQTDTDLPADQASPGGPTSAWPWQIKVHRQILGIDVDDALEIAEQTDV
jgi:hypothetical protein